MKSSKNNSNEKKLDINTKKQIYQYFAGIGAGVVSTSAGYPLDVIRVRLLFHKAATLNMSRGIGFAFGVSVCKSGLVWPLQKSIQEYVEKKSGIQSELGLKFISGMFGNVLPGILFNPANVVKVRFMEDPNTNKKLRSIVSHMYHQEGFSAFKKGIIPTLARDSLWGMVYFPLFTEIRNHFPKSDDQRKDFALNTSCAAMAAGLATLLTSSLDGVRLFEQKTHNSISGTHSFWMTLKKVLKPTWNNFGGTMSGVFRVAITTALGHVTFMEIMKLLEGDRTKI